MKSLKNLTGDSLEQLIDYSVVDQNGDEIGTLHSLWSDPDTGTVEFLGVKTGWLFGHNHVVPAGKAELDEATNVVRLPYTEDFIKEAPSMSADAEISEAEEADIYRYYGMTRETSAAVTADATGTTTIPSATDYVPEALGAAALADASGVGDGASQFGAPIAGTTTATPDAGVSSSAETVSGNNPRWRRTSRPADLNAGGGTGTAIGGTGSTASVGGSTGSDTGDSVRAALDDLAPSDSSGTREPSSTVSAGSYGTSNLYGSTGMSSPVSADAAGTGTLDDFDAAYKDAMDKGGSRAHESTEPGTPAPVDMADGGMLDDFDAAYKGEPGKGETDTALREAGESNADPITGEPGAHPVGTGVGAFGGGATGAAIGGALGGPIAPISAVVGGIIGAIGGGLAGKGVAESINPTEENAYWQSNYQGTSYFQNDYEYSDYAPAYKTGYEGYGKYSEKSDYASAEPDLKHDYEQIKGGSRLEWEKAKSATRDAWERLKAKASDTTK